MKVLFVVYGAWMPGTAILDAWCSFCVGELGGIARKDILFVTRYFDAVSQATQEPPELALPFRKPLIELLTRAGRYYLVRISYFTTS